MKKKKVETEKYDSEHEVQGYWRDVVYKKDENGNLYVAEDTGWKKNKILTGMSKLLAGLLKNEGTFTGGILYHAQGDGDPAWDGVAPIPDPGYSDTTLVSEVFRKAPLNIQYLDGAGVPTVTITNRIMITTLLDFGECNGFFLREHGIFGGDATAAADSGYLANTIRHRARYKDASISIMRYLKWVL